MANKVASTRPLAPILPLGAWQPRALEIFRQWGVYQRFVDAVGAGVPFANWKLLARGARGGDRGASFHRLGEAAAALRAADSWRTSPYGQADLDHWRKPARHSLVSDAASTWQEGEAMSLRNATATAREDETIRRGRCGRGTGGN